MEVNLHSVRITGLLCTKIAARLLWLVLVFASRFVPRKECGRPSVLCVSTPRMLQFKFQLRKFAAPLLPGTQA
jgi:hypothetical protein